MPKIISLLIACHFFGAELPVQCDCSPIQCRSDHQVEDEIQEADIVLLKNADHPSHLLRKIRAISDTL